MSGQKTKPGKPRDTSKRLLLNSKTAVRDVRLIAHTPSRRSENHNPFCTNCKEGGALLACDHCSRSYHLVCVNMRLCDVPYGPWFCHICIPTVDRKQREETAKQEKAEKLLKDQEVKRLLAKLSSSQKNKAVKKFAKKHPQFVKQSKIHYPIDDQLLAADPLLHHVTLTEKRPNPSALNIPPNLLGDLLYITDFLWTFKEAIGVAPFSVEKLYADLNGTEETMLLREINMAVVKVILESCISKEADSQLLPESHLTLLCKLIELIDLKEVVAVGYLVLLGELLRSNMWKIYAEDSKELSTLLKHKLDVAPIEECYYSYYSYDERVALLVFAIHCLFDTKTLHEELASRIDQRQVLAKTRQDLKSEMRIIEAKAKAKEKNGTITRQSITSNDKIMKLEEKLRRATEEMSEITVRTQSLGLDRDYNEYFMFDFDRSKLFVRMPNPLNSVRKPKDDSGYWYVYSTHEEVKGVLSSLIVKGIRESKLFEGLTAALPKFQFAEGEEESTSSEIIADRVYSNKFSCFDNIDCSVGGVKQLIKDIEKGFTSHLAKTSKNWDLPIPRNDWIEQVNAETDVEGLARLVLDFGTKANTPYKTLQNQPSSDEEEEEVDEMHYRRVNLRIWQDFGDSFSLWSFLLSTCKTASSLHLCLVVYERVLQNYYRKRPGRVPDSKKKLEDNSIRTRRKRSEELKETEVRKRLKEAEWEHDDVCFFCSKYGELMCCETCSRVVHPNCIGLDTIPSEDWYCDECQSKKETIPQTRSRTRLRKLA